MKKLVTSNNNILLIAGSGNFAYESAIHLYKINKLKKIFLISNNKLILKRFNEIVKVIDIRNLELIFKSIKKEKVLNVIIIGYATLTKINEIKEEKLLRENIRKVIKIVRERKQLKLQERQEGEQHMRKIIRHLIKEAEVADEDPAPGPTTGRNALDQLLKKIIPILEENYKLLTTDKAQRDSFRAHIVNAIKNSEITFLEIKPGAALDGL